MNLILLFEGDFASADRVRLRGRRARHVRDIHRAAVGDELCVGLVGDRIGSGRVTALDADSLEMEVSLDRDPPPALAVNLVIALPRPPILRRALHCATAMGVKRIALINARRVEKSYWQSHALGDGEIHRQLVLGLEQARDTHLPEVLLRPRFRPFVEDELPGWSSGTAALVAHPEAQTPFPREVVPPVTLALGPEGGFIPYEIERFQACGFSPVSLGERILRVDTALPALVGRLL